MTSKEYRSRPEISNSDIGNYIYGGIGYFNYKRKETGQSEDHFDLGEALHCYILEPETFDSRFCIVDTKLSGLMLKYVNSLIAQESESNHVVTDEMRMQAYRESGFAISYDRVQNEFNKPNIINAYEETKKAYGKTVLSREQLEAVQNMKVSLLHNSISRELFSSEHFEVHNELKIFWEHPIVEKSTHVDDIYLVQCKSMLDRVLIDKTNKKVILVDLKSTGKPVKQFPHYYRLYRYYRQMAFYVKALEQWLEDAPYKGWPIEPLIVTVGTITHESKVFTVSPEDLIYGTKEFEKALAELNWHLTTQVFTDMDNHKGIKTLLTLNDNSHVDGNEGESAETKIE